MAEVTFTGDFQMGTSGSPTSLTDYTGLIKSIKFSRNGETFDVTNLGTAAKKWIKGLTDAEVSIEFFKSTALAAALNNLLTYVAGGVSWQYGPDGTTTGNNKSAKPGR
jgi:hypothetical protein